MARLSMELVAETAGIKPNVDVWRDVNIYSLALNFSSPEAQRRYHAALEKLMRHE